MAPTNRNRNQQTPGDIPDYAIGFQSELDKMRKEYAKFLEDLDKNNGVFNRKLSDTYNRLTNEVKQRTIREQNEYRRETQNIEEQYRQGTIDAPERYSMRNDNTFAHRENVVGSTDLINELREIGDSIGQQSKDTNSLYKAFARERMINVGVNFAERIADNSPLAGYNVGNVMRSTISAYDQGDSLKEKLKLGAIGFAVSSAIEGITKVIENTTQLNRTINQVAGIGGGKQLYRDFSPEDPNVVGFQNMGINYDESLQIGFQKARSSGTRDKLQSRALESSQIERALSLSNGSINGIGQFTRVMTGGKDENDAVRSLFSALNSVNPSKYNMGTEGDLSNFPDKLQMFMKIIGSIAAATGEVDPSKAAELVGRFSKTSDFFAPQLYEGFSAGLQNQNPGMRYALLRTLAETYPGENKALLERRIANGTSDSGFDVWGKKYVERIKGMSEGQGEYVKNMIEDQMLQGVPQNLKKELWKMFNGDIKTTGTNQEVFASEANNLTMNADRYRANTFNETSNFGEETIEVYEKIQNFLPSVLSKVGGAMVDMAMIATGASKEIEKAKKEIEAKRKERKLTPHK